MGTIDANGIYLPADGDAPSEYEPGIVADFEALSTLMDVVSVTVDSVDALQADNTHMADDVLWEAKGDLAVGTASAAASRLAAGSNGQILTADSTQTTGLKWTASGGPGSGDIATDTIFDAKGDLAVGSGANSAVKVTVGANGTGLVADSGQTAGVAWEPLAPVSVTVVDAVIGASSTDGIEDTFSRGDHDHGLPDGDTINAELPVFDGDTQGVVPTGGPGYLYSDGTYQNPVGTGQVATDQLWNVKGDLAVASAADTAVRLPVGSPNLQVSLTPDSDATSGLAWIQRSVYATADSSARQNNTLLDDDELLWTIGNDSEIWFFQGFLMFTGANTTMDIRVGLSVPSGGTAAWGALAQAAGTDMGGFHGAGASGTPGGIRTAIQTIAVGSSTAAKVGMSIAGTIFGGPTGGDVALQWAQNTTNANDLIRNLGSVLLLWRLA